MFYIFHGFGVQIAGDADFQRDAVIVYIVQKIAVFFQPRAMPDAVSAAIVQSLMDGFWPVCFAGVDGDIQVVF